MNDFSIIIPHRGNPMGLWATIHSCEEDLRYSKFSYNYVVVSNGEEQPSDETTQALGFLKRAGKLIHYHNPEPLTPPAARQKGVDLSDGRYLFFFDNHCLVSRQYFERAMLDLERNGMDMLHSATQFFSGDVVNYHYRLKLDYNFWAEGTAMPQKDWGNYAIAAAGHGAFVVSREAWDDIGGYGPDGLFVGYGGEEMVFDLKMWLYGRRNHLDPKLLHYHYAGVRGYDRHFSDDYYTNLMASAHVIGGEKWLYKVFESFTTKTHIRIKPKRHMYDLMETAYNRTAQYAKEVAARRLWTLDELLHWFQANQVAM